MLIKRCSPFSGKSAVREIDVTQTQINDWRSGTLIQDAMPHLSADDREFILTGISPEEWDDAFDIDE